MTKVMSRHMLMIILLGTSVVLYNDIKWSSAEPAGAGLALSGATLTAGRFITGGGTFVEGRKDIPLYLKHDCPYEVEIDHARNLRMVLYDTKDRTGWLVDGASALLHLSRAKLSQKPYKSSCLLKLDQFLHADPHGGADAAEVALRQSRNLDLPIFETSETWTETHDQADTRTPATKRKTTTWRFRDLVRETWHILEQVHDSQNKSSPNIELRGTCRDKLEGFEFMDIVKEKSPLVPKVAVLEASGKGWVDFTRSIRATNLLGQGFGQLIRPTTAAGIQRTCKHWYKVPSGEDYLAVRVHTLEEIAEEIGGLESSPMKLAHGVFWCRGEKLFETCGRKTQSRCKGCDRVQSLHSTLHVGKYRQPKPAQCPDGAVIFGRSARFSLRGLTLGTARSREASESAVATVPCPDSGLGSSIGTQPGSSSSKSPQVEGDNVGEASEESASGASPVSRRKTLRIGSPSQTVCHGLSTEGPGQETCVTDEMDWLPQAAEGYSVMAAQIPTSNYACEHPSKYSDGLRSAMNASSNPPPRRS